MSLYETIFLEKFCSAIVDDRRTYRAEAEYCKPCRCEASWGFSGRAERQLGCRANGVVDAVRVRSRCECEFVLARTPLRIDALRNAAPCLRRLGNSAERSSDN